MSSPVQRRNPWHARLLCKRCGSSYKVRRRTVRLRWGPARFVFQAVPILACTKCGEILYFPSVLRKLEGKMKAYLRQKDVAQFRYGA